MWDEITYPFPNFNNGVTVENWERISNFIPHFTGRVITYPVFIRRSDVEVQQRPTKSLFSSLAVKSPPRS